MPSSLAAGMGSAAGVPGKYRDGGRDLRIARRLEPSERAAATHLGSTGPRKASIEAAAGARAPAPAKPLATTPPEGSLAALEASAIEAAVAEACSEPQGEVATAARMFLAEALLGVPVPSPWAVQKDPCGRTWFVDRNTGEVSDAHPMQGTLQQLAGLFAECWQLPGPSRCAMLDAAREAWESSHVAELKLWYKVAHDDGQFYYVNASSAQTTWEDPLGMLLPVHFLRCRAAGWLASEAYIDYLCITCGAICGRGDVLIPCGGGDSAAPAIGKSAGPSPAPPHGVTLLGRTHHATEAKRPWRLAGGLLGRGCPQPEALPKRCVAHEAGRVEGASSSSDCRMMAALSHTGESPV